MARVEPELPVRTLRVHYLIKGNLETDVRQGFLFRWLVDGTALHVFEHDDQHRTVWAKTYLHPVSAETGGEAIGP